MPQADSGSVSMVTPLDIKPLLHLSVNFKQERIFCEMFDAS